jgi:hypothetical protein
MITRVMFHQESATNVLCFNKEKTLKPDKSYWQLPNQRRLIISLAVVINYHRRVTTLILVRIFKLFPSIRMVFLPNVFSRHPLTNICTIDLYNLTIRRRRTLLILHQALSRQ